MANTTFIDGTTVVQASWLNDINDVAYDVLGNGTNVPVTKADVRSNLNVPQRNGTDASGTWPISVTGTSSNVTGTVAIGNGGTGQTTAPAAFTALKQSATATSTGVILTPRGYIAGLNMSTPGSSNTITVSSGQATDSTNNELMNLAFSISKTTANWAVGGGLGGLDTGTIAANTWYYFFLIRRPDTGVVDVLFSLNSTSPTLPTNYTQFRYIGAALTNGSSLWTKFYQLGDEFIWEVPFADINVISLGTTQTSFTVSVPRGRVMRWHGLLNFGSTSNTSLGIGNPSQVLPAASFSNGDLYQSTSAATEPTAASLITNTSAQISAIANTTSTNFRVKTIGWTDNRGRDA